VDMDFKLPKLGEGAESGSVVSLLVKVGDHVTKGQALLELESEKAVAPIPSSVTGQISQIRVKVGDKVSVGQLLMTIEESGPAKPKASAPIKTAAAEPPSKRAEAGIDSRSAAEAEAVPSGGDPAAAPSIRRMARDLGIDLTRIRGSERGGRIVLEDLRNYIQRLHTLAAPSPTAPTADRAAAPAVATDFSQWGEITKKPMSPLRKTIARRMAENWNAIPHVTQFDEADITALMELRKKYASSYEAKGTRLTLTAFALKAAAGALRKHPIFNSSLDERAQEIVLKEYCHIGLAVDTEQGLLVPVIRDVDKKDLLQLSRDISDLAARARERKVSLEEMKGGTFTISNQGGIGGAHFTPIVNKPEVAILGLGAAAWKARVREQKVEPRLLLPIAVSYDHRVIDGGTAARFTTDLVAALEHFSETDVKV
jgi:pyruvate dehydrogenase E2 component (dihydrolipoamide acetyltransferase)